MTARPVLTPEIPASNGQAFASSTGYIPSALEPRQSSDLPGSSGSFKAGDGGATSLASNVAVLFARADSIYKTLGCDVYDLERDALTYPGGKPVVAHPPCRAWGRLRHFARPREGERELALWAVLQVRRWGGVLEHPAASLLWREAKLPKPGKRDAVGGWTMSAPQWWWGHRADKPTLLYICGVEPRDLPEVPFKLGKSECVIRLDKRRPDGTHIRKGDADYRPALGDKEREATPEAFARWLVFLALLAGRGSDGGGSWPATLQASGPTRSTTAQGCNRVLSKPGSDKS